MKRIYYFIFIILIILSTKTKAAKEFDTVILNGSVYDSSSDSFLDKYNIGIKNGKIDEITKENINGKIKVDATDKYVLPGFIDSFQRHYGEAFDEYRLFDGVTTSIYVTDDDFDSFVLNDTLTISNINRILLKDISNIYAVESQEEAYSDFKTQVNKAITDGFAGFYIKPRTADNLSLDFIDKSFPLYLDLENISPNLVMSYLNLLVEHGHTERNIHIIAVNKFYNIINDLINFVNENKNFTIGGYPFSYVNVNPKNENTSFLEPLNNHMAVNKNDKIEFTFNTNNFSDNAKYSITSAIDNDTINNIALCENFTSESYDILPGAMMTTQDANTFMGRLFLLKNLDKANIAIEAQTKRVSDIFNAFDSPLQNKGKLQIGSDADIIVVDFKKITPHSSIAELPHKSTGITDLFREGVQIIEDGKIKSNLPKARWIKRSLSPFKKLDNIKIKLRHSKSRELNAINYKDSVLISLKDFAEYLNLIYEANSGVTTIGGIIQTSIGNNYFAIGTNKTELTDPPILINDGIYISIDSIQKIMEGYFDIKFDGDVLQIKKASKSSLLEAPLEDNEVNIVIDNKKIIYVYLLSAILLMVLIIYLNTQKKKKGK